MPNPDFGHIPPCSCGNRKPQHVLCVDCERQYCESCAAVIDGELVCRSCEKDRDEAAIEGAEGQECTCTEEYVDVDRTVAYGPCKIHFKE